MGNILSSVLIAVSDSCITADYLLLRTVFKHCALPIIYRQHNKFLCSCHNVCIFYCVDSFQAHLTRQMALYASWHNIVLGNLSHYQTKYTQFISLKAILMHNSLHYFKILQVYSHKMAIATKIGLDECQGKELLFHRLLRTNCVNNIKFQVLNQVFYYRYWSHVTVWQSILKAFQCFQHPLCSNKLNANLPLLEIIFTSWYYQRCA